MKNGYTEKDFRDIIESMGLQEEYNKNIEKYGAQKSDFDIVGYTATKFLREGFFKMYPGAEERIQREIQFARKHGYIQHMHGIKRMVPELLMLHFDQDNPDANTLVGTDRSFYLMLLNNLLNVCANSNIQGSEPPHAFMLASWALWTIKKWNSFLKEHNSSYRFLKVGDFQLITAIFNNVHDSDDFYIPKSQQEILLPLIRYCMEYPVLPGLGVPLPTEMEVVDVSQGQVYKHGKTVEAEKDLQKVIKDFCEKNNLPLLPMPEIPTHEDGTPFTGFIKGEPELYIKTHPESLNGESPTVQKIRKPKVEEDPVRRKIRRRLISTE